VPQTIRRWPFVAGVLVLLAAVGVGVAACGGDDSADLPAGVVARVGDASISEEQLDRAVSFAAAQARAQGQSVPAEGAEGYDQFRSQALQTLVQQKVVAFEARECGNPCKVTEKEIDDDLARIIETEFQGKQKEFDDFLKDRGITEADARDIVKNGLQQQKLFDHVTRGVRFTDADAKAYYEEHPDEFKVEAGRAARHILVETKAEADRLSAEVTPENFARLAEQNSTDTGSARQGGSLGQIQKGQLVPEFEKAAFALKDGEISKPVKTQFGWHIIMVDITPARTTSFADAKDQIISSQLDQKRQTEFMTWSEEVVEDWNGRTVYADPDLEPATTEAEQPPGGATAP
jgi:parvulin-like peptidyl-prolyl isomerase